MKKIYFFMFSSFLNCLCMGGEVKLVCNYHSANGNSIHSINGDINNLAIKGALGVDKSGLMNLVEDVPGPRVLSAMRAAFITLSVPDYFSESQVQNVCDFIRIRCSGSTVEFCLMLHDAVASESIDKIKGFLFEDKNSLPLPGFILDGFHENHKIQEWRVVIDGELFRVFGSTGTSLADYGCYDLKFINPKFRNGIFNKALKQAAKSLDYESDAHMEARLLYLKEIIEKEWGMNIHVIVNMPSLFMLGHSSSVLGE